MKINYTTSKGIVTAKSNHLDQNESIYLDVFPKNLKKNIGLTFSASFDSFSSVTLGKGYEKYRGDWFEIDCKYIKWMHYESETEIKELKEHGLSIKDQLLVSICIDEFGICKCSVSTVSGIYSCEFAMYHEQNGTPFLFASQPLKNISYSAVVTDINSSIWMFGDSYFGYASSRVIGQLENLGYGINCLIDGLAGQNSIGAYQEISKLLALGGRPDHVIWCLGMNDSLEQYNCQYQLISELQRKYNFELILSTIPVIPSQIEAKNGINSIVKSSGYRYIDACTAVGADECGNWYPKHMHTDGVHPLDAGAKAIAMRIITDVPEIMFCQNR